VSKQHRSDILIIGSGAAGLTLALRLARHYRIALIAKEELTEGATYYAQGGVSVVLDKDDSTSSHIADTLDAGAGLCEPDIVRFTVERARDCIQWLVDSGVPFTQEQGTDGETHFHLTREGGHSHRRIVHAADATGQAIENTLVARAKAHPNIEIFEHHLAVDLVTGDKLSLSHNRCLGAYVLDVRNGTVMTFGAHHTVLATGGTGKVYLYTTNPDVASGDGIAMAWRAGCRVANMEFIQFHPTCLYHPRAKSFLLTEAIRGEGGHLLLPDGQRFMGRFDPRAELAPRDIVARAIDHEMKRLGAEHLYLDISHRPKEFILSHFPMIYEKCLQFGFDMTREPLPVVPAAHYLCGGVVTGPSGQTDIEGLYAIGEMAYTGLHGANRMASNSLLECLVFATTACQDIETKGVPAPSDKDGDRIPDWDESQVTDSEEEVFVTHNWDELRRFMWDYVGIVRSDKRLHRARRRCRLLSQEIDQYYGDFRITGDLIELRNLVLIADLIIRSALLRKESRGLHYNLDYPIPDLSQPPTPTTLAPDNFRED